MNLLKTPKTLTWLPILILFSNCSHLMNRGQAHEKARLYLQRGVDQFNEREYNGAVESTLEAIKQDPQLAPAYNHLALIYMETKRYPKSEEAFKKALEIQPNYPEVFNNYGVLLNRQDKFNDAISYFEKALANEKYMTPENAYTNLGYAYYRMGRIRDAKTAHQKSLDVNPQFCLASKNMGDVYAKEKNFSKAADYFQSAITQCPLFQESQYKLGLVLMKMGQKQVAKAQLEKLVQRHKSGPYVDRSHEVLKYLR